MSYANDTQTSATAAKVTVCSSGQRTSSWWIARRLTAFKASRSLSLVTSSPTFINELNAIFQVYLFRPVLEENAAETILIVKNHEF